MTTNDGASDGFQASIDRMQAMLENGTECQRTIALRLASMPEDRRSDFYLDARVQAAMAPTARRRQETADEIRADTAQRRAENDALEVEIIAGA